MEDITAKRNEECMNDVYQSPFAERYSSKEMLHLFSPQWKFETWRKLWVALAKAEHNLGIGITEEQIAELELHITDIDYELAHQYERKLKHDVMAHIRTYGDQCPKAKGIIHLGATSAYVVDNTDIIAISEAYTLIEKQLRTLISALANLARKYASLPTVAFTHFQPAQFTTLGKRACLWINDLLMDLDEIQHKNSSLKMLGAKGTTGTQASFMALFNNDENKVKELDNAIAREFGFEETYSVSGQTYSRKIDSLVHNVLAGIAQSAHKFANDMRLLQHTNEVQEPFGSEQVGSSAMAYKRNPMKSERMTSLARFVITLWSNAAFTAASQWFERTLDDSAGKRIALPEAFLATDAILRLYIDIVSGIVVNEDVIAKHVNEELPAIATENILMEATLAGGDRQELHERIRLHTIQSVNGDLLDRIKSDVAFVNVKFDEILQPKNYIGRATSQTLEFLESNADIFVGSRDTFEVVEL